MAKTVNVWIDGHQLEVPAGMTIIEAADKHGFYIPVYATILIFHPPPTAASAWLKSIECPYPNVPAARLAKKE